MPATTIPSADADRPPPDVPLTNFASTIVQMTTQTFSKSRDPLDNLLEELDSSTEENQEFATALRNVDLAMAEMETPESHSLETMVQGAMKLRSELCALGRVAGEKISPPVMQKALTALWQSHPSAIPAFCFALQAICGSANVRNALFAALRGEIHETGVQIAAFMVNRGKELVVPILNKSIEAMITGIVFYICPPLAVASPVLLRLVSKSAAELGKFLSERLVALICHCDIHRFVDEIKNLPSLIQLTGIPQEKIDKARQAIESLVESVVTGCAIAHDSVYDALINVSPEPLTSGQCHSIGEDIAFIEALSEEIHDPARTSIGVEANTLEILDKRQQKLITGLQSIPTTRGDTLSSDLMRSHPPVGKNAQNNNAIHHHAFL